MQWLPSKMFIQGLNIVQMFYRALLVRIQIVSLPYQKGQRMDLTSNALLQHRLYQLS